MESLLLNNEPNKLATSQYQKQLQNYQLIYLPTKG